MGQSDNKDPVSFSPLTRRLDGPSHASQTPANLKQSLDPAFEYHNFGAVLFRQPQLVFSQWVPSVFTVGELLYNYTEQHVMAEKAKLPDDDSTLSQSCWAPHRLPLRSVITGWVGQSPASPTLQNARRLLMSESSGSAKPYNLSTDQLFRRQHTISRARHA